MKKMMKLIVWLVFIFLIISIFLGYFYYKKELTSPFSTNSNKVIFEVKTGESKVDVAKRLMDEKLISSDFIFLIYAKLESKDIMPGFYEFESSMSIEEIYNKMSSGDTKITKVTIPEGYRLEQIAKVLDEKELVSYRTFIEKAKPYEGKLFPDTYYISPDKTVDDIVNTMTANYEKRVSNLKVSLEDLIIASIVEREANRDEQRPIIAGIYKNRLKSGMKLQSDPTVQYGKDSLAIMNLNESDKKSYKFWRAATNEDFVSVDSNYNTYKVSGLPYGPICNPGLASISATVNYTPSEYLYFIVADDTLYPAKTYAEHKENVQKYLN